MRNTDDVRRALVKQVRRGIIDLLNLAYPAALDYDTICGSFVDTDEHYIKRDLSYLVEAGYLTWVNKESNAPWAGRKFRLTTEGVDLALKINTDPAISP